MYNALILSMGHVVDRKHKRNDVAKTRPWFILSAIGIGVVVAVLFMVGYTTVFALLGSGTVAYVRASGTAGATATNATTSAPAPVLDVAAYNKKLLAIANYKTPIATTTSTSTPVVHRLWPAKAVLPLAGALLPFNRIVAYYGNFYSKGMGVLGEYPEAQVLQMLASTTARWQAADPSTPVIPAIDYIAVTAQGSAGSDGKYRFRMPDDQIQKALDMAAQIHGIVFLDVQVGLSNVQTEVPLLRKYLMMPQVHLSLDPEFAMQTSGRAPGTVIGTMSAADINFAANYLAALVTEYNLPPKILVIHRFTEDMVTSYRLIKPLPQVQVVMDMDGWGYPAKKINTYTYIVAAEPVQFTGFKLFYKADLQPPSMRLMTPSEVLNLIPAPSYIQYQ
jgi:hypothetical protein